MGQRPRQFLNKMDEQNSKFGAISSELLSLSEPCVLLHGNNTSLKYKPVRMKIEICSPTAPTSAIALLRWD
jgi:hypothetical protein